ncbi:MAG: NADPH:quinone reductase [Deltaproteobacteria bacterium]|nr:NADPH:quinone reductase [Deltaproteobacteria bacterium]
MKAIRVHEFGGPEVMKIEEVVDPKPGAGEVVVRIYAAGVNPVDTYMRSGGYALKPSLPYTPGLDGAGIVESVGEGVLGLKAGDRVYIAGSISGSYAEKTLCRESQAHLLPDNISFSQGACLYVPYGAAYHALFHKAKALPGDVVLVHGASGGVGIAALQLARAAGMKVIGTSSTDKGQGLVMEQGAHHVVNHNDPGHFEQILALTNGRGVDVILEMLANINLDRDLGILAQNGRVSVIGSRGRVDIDLRQAMGRGAAIMGMVVMQATERETLSIHSAIRAGLENGTLRPVVGREMPLSEAPAAHHEIMEKSAFGKIILVP